MKSNERCPAIAEQQRQKVVVVSWSDEKQSGVLRDKTGATYAVGVADLLPECQGKLWVGEFVSAILRGYNDATGVFVEEYSHERPQFESVGQDDAPGWEPRGTPDRGKGTPDPGRWSHPQLHEEKKNGN